MALFKLKKKKEELPDLGELDAQAADLDKDIFSGDVKDGMMDHAEDAPRIDLDMPPPPPGDDVVPKEDSPEVNTPTPMEEALSENKPSTDLEMPPQLDMPPELEIPTQEEPPKVEEEMEPPKEEEHLEEPPQMEMPQESGQEPVLEEPAPLEESPQEEPEQQTESIAVEQPQQVSVHEESSMQKPPVAQNIPQGPLFIRLDSFAEVLNDFTTVHSVYSTISGHVANLDSLRKKEDMQLAKWQGKINEIQKNIEKIEGALFEGE